MKILAMVFGAVWGLLNFVLYFDAGADRALMVAVNFAIVGYVASRFILERVSRGVTKRTINATSDDFITRRFMKQQ